MGYLRLVLIISIFWINGCASSKAVHKKNTGPQTMLDVYAHGSGQAKKDVAQFIENNLKEQKTFGYVKPYIPVMKAPEVRKVWVPGHKSPDNPDVMIAGHWNYVVIQPSRWFIENNVIDNKLPVIIPTKQKSNEVKPYATEHSATREDI